MGISREEWNKLLKPLDFLNIEGSGHDCDFEIWKEHALRFYGRKQEFEIFVDSFIEFIGSFNLVHEDESMTMFALSLRKHVGNWYL